MAKIRPSTAADLPVQPEIPRSRFAEGMARPETYARELHLGRFSEGMEAHPDWPEHSPRGRFSLGQEELPDADQEKHLRRRYSQGLEGDRSVGAS